MKSLILRSILISSMCLCSIGTSKAQKLNGLGTSDYLSISSTYLNPSFLSSTANKIALDISGLGFVGMNKNVISIPTLINSGELKVNSSQSGDFHTNMSLEFRPLAVKFRISKLDFAVTTRLRTGINASTTDEKFLQFITGNDLNLDLNDVNISSTYAHASVIGDLGFSTTIPEIDLGGVRFSAGATLRYYRGGINTGLNFNNLRMSYNATTDSVDVTSLSLNAYNSSPEVFTLSDGDMVGNMMDVISGSKAGSGMGGDLGVSFLMGTANSPGNYKLRVGLSVTDIGSIKYNHGTSYFASGSAKFAAKDFELNSTDFDSIKAELQSLGFVINDRSSNQQKYNLPSMLNLNLDYLVKNRFYLSGYLGLNLINPSKNVATTPSFVTVSPRFMSRVVDLAAPITYDFTNSNFDVGLAARFYFFYIGTQSFIGLFREYAPSSSVYAGINVAFGKGDQKRYREADQ